VLKDLRPSPDPLSPQGEELRLEQDVLAPLAAGRKLYVYMTKSFWRQIKAAGYRLTSYLKLIRPYLILLTHRSAVPANALILASYKTTNPSLLRNRSPTIVSSSPGLANDKDAKKEPEIVEPCFIDETAQLDPTARIGPNVSIGAGVKIGFGVRVRDAIVLDNTTLEVGVAFFL
jgi:mannose-1-phosphate guanylyltransferase